MLIFDIETNGLLDRTDKTHCISILEGRSSVVETYSDSGAYKPISTALERLSCDDCIIGHNVLCFDIPALQKIYPSFVPKGSVVDTLVLSRLIWPNLSEIDYDRIRHAKTPSDLYFNFPTRLIGSHSLRAWGYRLGVLKGDFSEDTDWQEWSEAMCEYNRQDVVVTKALYELIEKTVKDSNWSMCSIRLEHDFQKVIFQQELNGFPFDKEKAVQYYAQLSAEREELTQKLQSTFPPVDKGDWFTPKVNNKTRGYVKGQTIWRPKLIPFNPASRQDIAERLKAKYGWEPAELTEKGAAKVDDEVLERLEYPEAKDIARYLLLQKRIGQLAEGQNAWLKLVQPDGRIHGHVITNGAVTGRCTHTNPNMAQVPAVGVEYGAEFRSLFYAPEGWHILGADASGLELRCLAHYMARYDGGAYAQKILSGDIHWANAQALGLVGPDEIKDPDNPQHMWARNKIAKRWIYGFLYGAGDHKLGEVMDLTPDEVQALLMNVSKRKAAQIEERLVKQYPYKKILPLDIAEVIKGEQMRRTFLSSLPAMEVLIERVKETAKERGYLKGIDGRHLPIRSQHSAFNTLLQSAGAVAVKKATCILWEDLKAEGLDKDVQQVAHVHDEYQLLVKEGIEERVGEIAVHAFRKAGEFFHFRIPLDGEFKIGRNWAETH